ncbi:OmpA family protein [Oligoflexus tunisiensis]|uniref:OmpA family protein n=1 Tax=Oligoflexus tunisiensis TaxID=708132 RepID=UPI000B06625C|nr:OmpA family protein [Oligoflexus tunisiensis]
MKAFRLILGFSLSASASVGLANITGSDLQNFNATTNGLDFVTVQSSETLGKGIFNLGLFSNYAVNTLPRYEDASGRDANVNDSIVAADINFGMGLTSFWDIGISIPSVIYQDVNFDGDRGQFDKNGVTEIRANSKWRLYGDRDGGIAFILGTNVNVTENNPYTGSGSGPTFNFEFAFDTTFNKIALGANIGYRKRSPGERVAGFPIQPLEDQYIASLAASYLFTSIDTKLIFEYYAGMPTKSTETVKSRSASAAEMLLGMKHDLTDALAFHAGAGTEAGNGTASADWRVYTGINYVFGGEGEKKAPQMVAPQKPKASAPMIPKFVQTPEPGPAEPAGEGDEVFVLRGINFVFDSASRVLPGTREILTNLGQHLKKNAIEKVIIEGHTDSVGQEKYNYDLGLQRARVIREYLVRSEKLDPNTIEARSYGEARPVADNGNFQGRQLNRRVVFRIIYKK